MNFVSGPSVELIAIAKQHLEATDRRQYLELVDAGTFKPGEKSAAPPSGHLDPAYIGPASHWERDDSAVFAVTRRLFLKILGKAPTWYMTP